MAERLGLKLPVSMEQRMTGAAKVGEHNTSTLQDLEAGRPLELEAVVGAVLELGERLGVPAGPGGPARPGVRPSVPSMGRIYRDERISTELMTTTVAKRKA